MFLIRQAKPSDLGTLLKLAQTVHFINLPADREVISAKIAQSQHCFTRAAGGRAGSKPTRSKAAENGAIGLSAAIRRADQFMFVLVDTEAGGEPAACLGTSQIMAHMGGPGNPNFSLKLSRRQFFSQSLQTGTSHMVARLFPDESGPTEVGGLILQTASRGNKLGRFLSLIRFHFIALNRPLFADRVIAEMMGPITVDGVSPLWEALGRRFIPLSYAEADKHCQRSREFISALLPKDDIYLSLLPPEARDAVGKVHEETLPARAMLEKLGFACKDLVDCFDGGPQLEATTDSIPLVKATYRDVLGEPLAERREDETGRRGFVSHLDADGEFRAADVPYDTDARGRIRLPRAVMDELAWSVGLGVGVTPVEDGRPGARPSASRSKQGRSRKVGT